MRYCDRRGFLRVFGAAMLATGIFQPARSQVFGTMMTREVPSSGESLGVIGYGGSDVYRNASEANRTLALELVDILVDIVSSTSLHGAHLERWFG